MPRPVDKSETVDLHAPWWCPVRTEDGTTSTRVLKDSEDGGRYLERWVVRKEKSEGNERNINRQLKPVMRVPVNKARGNVSMSSSEVTMEQSADQRTFTLLEMTVEITDEKGVALHLSKDMIASFPTRDTEWVDGELEKLYSAPIIEPTEDDELTARRLQEKAEYEGKPVPEDADPTAVAVSRFRKPR